MKSVEEILLKVENLVFENALPNTKLLSEQNYDSLLEARDSNEFAIPWSSAYNLVSKRYKGSEVPQVMKNRVDKIREHLYKRVYNNTKLSDLASYISDDFDLILMCLIARAQNSWVNALWLSYQKGYIPSGTLIEAPGNVTDIIS